MPEVGILSLAATCYTSARPEPAGGPASQPATTPSSSSVSYHPARFLPFLSSVRLSVPPSVSFFLGRKSSRKSSRRRSSERDRVRDRCGSSPACSEGTIARVVIPKRHRKDTRLHCDPRRRAVFSHCDPLRRMIRVSPLLEDIFDTSVRRVDKYRVWCNRDVSTTRTITYCLTTHSARMKNVCRCVLSVLGKGERQ